MRIVVGLGNPGERYSRTRHNLGFLTVEEFCRRRRFEWRGEECRSLTARGVSGGGTVLVAKPETYMNRSGEAVSCLLERCGADASDLLVVCDDVALELGNIRLRPSGSDGGHLGLRSITESLGTQDFARLRIGIRTPTTLQEDLAEHVLAPLGDEEWVAVRRQILRAAECISVALEAGLRDAMNRFNRKQKEEPGGPPVESA